ncbi:hypothetical protein QYF36_019976 [Acer negundo]|nr:hypothetical protein QYF36_019976 [Acer negundo]
MDDESLMVKLEEEGFSIDVLWMEKVLGLYKGGLLNGKENSDGFTKKGVGDASLRINDQGDNASIIKDKGKGEWVRKPKERCQKMSFLNAKLDVEKNKILEYGDINVRDSVEREEGEFEGGMVVVGSNELIGDFVSPCVGNSDRW